jgi:iron complex transport system substrate-binding protein
MRLTMKKPILFALLLSLLSTAQAAETHSLEGAFGPIQVQPAPQRVVTLDEGALDTALALGVQPVGTVSTRGSDGISDYLKDRAGTPNLEAILRLKPDLIIAPAGLDPTVYAAYSRLAPTAVVKPSSSADWQATVRFYAQALGREVQGRETLAAIGLRAAAIKAGLKGSPSVSVVRWNPQGPVAMGSQVFVGQLLTAAGLRSTELASSLKRPHSDVLSLENLSKIDADWMFVTSLNADGAKTLAEARKQPAFERLDAVQKQRAVTVDGQVWSSGSGPLAAARVLDDLQQALSAQ